MLILLVCQSIMLEHVERAFAADVRECDASNDIADAIRNGIRIPRAGKIGRACKIPVIAGLVVDIPAQSHSVAVIDKR